MAGYLVDPGYVEAFLAKPYNLKEAWDSVAAMPGAACGAPPPAGNVFYTEAEKQIARDDAVRLFNEQAQNCRKLTRGGKQMVLSAGGPGAGKSTLLENLLKEKNSFLHDMIFADPDERGLKLMKVFQEDIERFGGGVAGLALSYTKWRWASNYINGAMMNRACAEGYDILHGTTATSPQVGLLYDNAHREGYGITTLLVAAPDAVREESARRRFEDEKTRFTADTVIKGRLFFERLPLLLEKTDNFRLYWRNAAQSAPVLVAEGNGGKVSVRDAAALSALEADCIAADPGLAWANLSARYS